MKKDNPEHKRPLVERIKCSEFCRKVREEYENAKIREAQSKNRGVNWREVWRGINGGIVVGMLGIMAITGLCVGAMKASKGKDR